MFQKMIRKGGGDSEFARMPSCQGGTEALDGMPNVAVGVCVCVCLSASTDAQVGATNTAKSG